jgi:hypothetical protein
MKKNNNKSMGIEKYVTARQASCHAWNFMFMSYVNTNFLCDGSFLEEKSDET